MSWAWPFPGGRAHDAGGSAAPGGAGAAAASFVVFTDICGVAAPPGYAAAARAPVWAARGAGHRVPLACGAAA
jgi:hypothetical protein